ncbi:MAG TPA: hypothetical protein VEZ90_11385 [Blastocatellia bacterium]|nr:hypothetical protein [Blastocatellia bacterium]
MSDRTHLIARIERVLQRLSSGLQPDDIANGWSDQSRTAMTQLFERLRSRLQSPEPLSEEDKRLSISRGMDSWGITGGDLLEEGAEISCELAELT